MARMLSSATRACGAVSRLAHVISMAASSMCALTSLKMRCRSARSLYASECVRSVDEKSSSSMQRRSCALNSRSTEKRSCSDARLAKSSCWYWYSKSFRESCSWLGSTDVDSTPTSPACSFTHSTSFSSASRRHRALSRIAASTAAPPVASATRRRFFSPLTLPAVTVMAKPHRPSRLSPEGSKEYLSVSPLKRSMTLRQSCDVVSAGIDHLAPPEPRTTSLPAAPMTLRASRRTSRCTAPSILTTPVMRSLPRKGCGDSTTREKAAASSQAWHMNMSGRRVPRKRHSAASATVTS
mmetsp:Transcript_21943/g.76939  ORF Transcript_21943/g.76939 Transcript_21943/m.76939 type:complete len:296 (+) Transcript_21943:1125-2012(+)